jgi:hypothetical protein
VELKRKLAEGERTTHKFLYILDDYAFIGYIQQHWFSLLKELFTYNKKFNNQNLIVDQGLSTEHGKFFLLVQVDLTEKQYEILETDYH